MSLIRQGIGGTMTLVGGLVCQVLGLVIYIWTIVIAISFSNAFVAVLSFTPVLAQIIWFIKEWNRAGTIMNPYCMAIIGWVAVAIVCLIGWAIAGKE